MIKNIMFDMGGVLIQFAPDLFMDRLSIAGEDRELIRRKVFRTVEWVRMDRGTLTDEEALEIFLTRLPERLHTAVTELVLHWDLMAQAIPGMEELIASLKAQGYAVYLLSNASYRQHEYWPNIEVSPYFTDTLISCDVHVIKPQPEIYQHALEKFGIRPEETVFIDDLPVNCEAAVNAGIDAFVFNEDVQALRDWLQDKGVRTEEVQLRTGDVVPVLLKRRGMPSEVCRVSYISEGIRGYLGKLLEEPRNLGKLCGKDSIISFFDAKASGKEPAYEADLTPEGTFLAEDFTDDHLVQAAMEQYREEPSAAHLDEVLRLLRDSSVWVPYIIASHTGEAQAEQSNPDSEDPLGLLGTRYVPGSDRSIQVPDLLQSADGSTYYFPVFTRENVLGDYAAGYAIRKLPFLEAVSLAGKSRVQTAGILVNAFTEPFLVNAQVFDMLLSLPTRISEPYNTV